VLAPGTTPPAIVARLHRAFAEAMAMPEIIRRVAELGVGSRVGGAESLRRWLDAETETWSGVIRTTNIKLD
jgi:tripartite-type tricarboxylate transporter receptor subunit TctC